MAGLSLTRSVCVCARARVFTPFDFSALSQVLLKLIALSFFLPLTDSEDFASPGATSHHGGRR